MEKEETNIRDLLKQIVKFIPKDGLDYNFDAKPDRDYVTYIIKFDIPEADYLAADKIVVKIFKLLKELKDDER